MQLNTKLFCLDIFLARVSIVLTRFSKGSTDFKNFPKAHHYHAWRKIILEGTTHLLNYFPGKLTVIYQRRA